MTYLEEILLTENPAFVLRVRRALYQWGVTQLVGSPTATNLIWAKTFIRERGDSENVRTMSRVAVVAPGLDPTIETDDAALQTRIDALVPTAITKEVLVIVDPDANKP